MSFLNELTGILNSGQSRSVVLTGNIYDLFWDGDNYVPLLRYLSKKYTSLPNPESSTKGFTQLIYELNNPITVVGADEQKEDLNRTWSRVSGGQKGLEDRLAESGKNATYALQLLHKICECSRLNKKSAANNLIVMVEAAGMLLPEEQISRMSLNDRKRVAIVQDWLSEPEFMDGADSVILLAESRSNIHSRISRMPQVLSVEISLPDITERTHFITNFGSDHKMTIEAGSIAVQTAGLSIHAIRQLMLSKDLSPENIARKVEEYMISQLGEGVVEFKRPSHDLDDCIGNTKVKSFLKNELIPGFQDGSIAGAAVGGPIGGGKTFICEAAASEVGCPVVLLKSIRSKWFGETDAIFERLYRLLKTFNQIMIFVDEADAQFGDIDGGHATERRLTGKIQAMMSDPQLLGKVIWFLMTARIHRLSADIRRPGRMDIIIPILDPEGQDRTDFIYWTFEGFDISSNANLDSDEGDGFVKVSEATKGYSAAAFAVLKRRIKKCSTIDEAVEIADDMVLPDIQEVREYQTLQAKLNCTRKSLISDSADDPTNGKGVVDFDKLRSDWKKKIAEHERQGVN